MDNLSNHSKKELLSDFPAFTVYIGLGSNLDSPSSQVQQAMREIDGLSATTLLAQSALYLSPPMGEIEQPDYINAVVKVSTKLTPVLLLASLQVIEKNHQRVRGVKWGPRTLDCDILLFGEKEMNWPDLTIPHPGMAERPFVLVPLQEIAPDLILPGKKGKKSMQQLIESLAPYSLKKLDVEKIVS